MPTPDAGRLGRKVTIPCRRIEGRGSTFIVSLPKHTATEQVAETDTGAMARPLRVLVADDQPLLCEILTEYLTNDCHSVVTAKDGREALERFSEGEFDLVITDQVMPKMTGHQLAGAIKTRSPSTPVVLVTGSTQALGNSIGQLTDYILNKPVSVIDLRHALVRVTTNLSEVALVR